MPFHTVPTQKRLGKQFKIMLHVKKTNTVLLFFFLCSSVVFFSCEVPQAIVTTSKNNKNIEYQIIPNKKNGIFVNNDRVGYDLMLKNKSNFKIRGVLNADVTNYQGRNIFSQQIGYSIDGRKAFSYDLKLDNAPMGPGFYQMRLINVAEGYNINDTIYSVYGVDPERKYPTINLPTDFLKFWDNAKSELQGYDPKFRITRRGDKATRTLDIYLVEFESVDNYTIRGWLSIPKMSGKFSVLYQLPAYVTGFEPETERTDMAVFRLNVRGHGNSQDPMVGEFGSFATTDMNDASKFIYKKVYLDALRGLDFLYKSAHLRLDTSKIMVYGEGQGATIATAVCALDPRPAGCIIERPVFADIGTLMEMAATRPPQWPTDIFTNYISSSGMSTTDFYKLWDYHDPVNFAAFIRCPVLFGHSLLNQFSPPQCAISVYNQLASDKREMYISPNTNLEMDYIFYAYKDRWVKKVLRLP